MANPRMVQSTWRGAGRPSSETQYFWRAIGTDDDINVVVVTEVAFTKGAKHQQLAFRLDYDHLHTPCADGSVRWKQRAAIAPGVVALAIRCAVTSTPSFTGNIGGEHVTLSAATIRGLQERARLSSAAPSDT